MTHTSKGFYYFLLTFLDLEQISCSLYWIVLEYFFLIATWVVDSISFYKEHSMDLG